MSAKLNEMMISTPPIFTQSREFRTFIEPYIPMLRNHPEVIKLPLNGEIRYLYNFSLESYLLSKGLDLEDIAIIQRINNIEYSHTIDPSKDFIVIPSESQLYELKSIFKNRQNK